MVIFVSGVISMKSERCFFVKEVFWERIHGMDLLFEQPTFLGSIDLVELSESSYHVVINPSKQIMVFRLFGYDKGASKNYE